MAGSIPERDWKYMKKIKDELIARLCERINKESVAILNEDISSENEKYFKQYKHVQDSDSIIANCFDDWRRSTLLTKLITLQHHKLISKEHIGQLSEETNQKLKAFMEMQGKNKKPNH